jgi:hypothetical protein
MTFSSTAAVSHHVTESRWLDISHHVKEAFKSVSILLMFFNIFEGVAIDSFSSAATLHLLLSFFFYRISPSTTFLF